MNLAIRPGMQKEVVAQLLQYRRSKELLMGRALDNAKRAELARWVRVIDCVHNAYKCAQSEKARAMERLFGFTHPVPHLRNTRKRIILLAVDFCVSEPTMYKWREEFIAATLLAAAEAGALKPFGIAP